VNPIRERIQAAAELIQTPTQWCQGAMARNARGKPTKVFSGKRWCPIGAVFYAANVDVEFKGADIEQVNAICAALCVMQSVATRMHKMSLERVNDVLGHEYALAVMRQAWREAGGLTSARKF
jgi:hypothetical protein